MSSTNEEYVEGIYLNDGTLKKFKDADLTQKVAELNSNKLDKFILLHSAEKSSPGTYSYSSGKSASSVSLFLIIHRTGSTYDSQIVQKGAYCNLNHSIAESGYYQTTFCRNIKCNDSNFVIENGYVGRASMTSYSTYNDGCVIARIYGIVL